MGKFIGFDIDHKNPVACITQSSYPDQYMKLKTEAGALRQWLQAQFISVSHLVLLGIEIVGFFVLMRLISFRWPIKPVLAFDRIGGPLVDPTVESRMLIARKKIGSQPHGRLTFRNPFIRHGQDHYLNAIAKPSSGSAAPPL